MDIRARSYFRRTQETGSKPLARQRASADGKFQSDAAHGGGVLFLNSPSSVGMALDAATGATRWVYNPKSYEAGSYIAETTDQLPVEWIDVLFDGLETTGTISMCDGWDYVAHGGLDLVGHNHERQTLRKSTSVLQVMIRALLIDRFKLVVRNDGSAGKRVSFFS